MAPLASGSPIYRSLRAQPRYPRLRDSTSHTTAAMTAITIMAMITLPIVSLCTIVSTLAHHTSGWETQDRAHRQRREARAVASYFLLSVTLHMPTSTGSSLHLKHHIFYDSFQVIYEFRLASSACVFQGTH
jgi:hypothetical protein